MFLKRIGYLKTEKVNKISEFYNKKGSRTTY